MRKEKHKRKKYINENKLYFGGKLERKKENQKER